MLHIVQSCLSFQVYKRIRGNNFACDHTWEVVGLRDKPRLFGSLVCQLVEVLLSLWACLELPSALDGSLRQAIHVVDGTRVLVLIAENFLPLGTSSRNQAYQDLREKGKKF